jgi:hypothetical protein
MRTLGLIRAATPPPPHDLWPRLRARLRDAENRVALDLPAFGWGWRLVAAAAVGLPLVVPEPLRFLSAAGLL